MRAGLRKGDLDLPAAEEVADDLLGGEFRLVGDERLRLELAQWVAQQYPADGDGEQPAAEPDGGIGAQ